MSTSRARGFLLTINNPTNEDKIALESDDFKYLVYQYEKGEEGTLHIQAFIYYANARVFPKKKFPRAHIEAAKNINAAMNYCKKEESRVEGPFEFGDPPGQGRRTDLEAVANDILKGKSLKTVAVENPDIYVRYFKGLKALQYEVWEHRTEAPQIIWLWGKSGVGKTSYVFKKHARDEIYIKDGTPWWDGYNRQEAILIDDFDGRWPFRDFLRLNDRYPYQGQYKGGYIKINSPYIYITCEFPPEHFYGAFDENELEQVKRRITECIELKADTA